MRRYASNVCWLQPPVPVLAFTVIQVLILAFTVIS